MKIRHPMTLRHLVHPHLCQCPAAHNKHTHTHTHTHQASSWVLRENPNSGAPQRSRLSVLSNEGTPVKNDSSRRYASPESTDGGSWYAEEEEEEEACDAAAMYAAAPERGES